jgi:hypothetical protein
MLRRRFPCVLLIALVAASSARASAEGKPSTRVSIQSNASGARLVEIDTSEHEPAHVTISGRGPWRRNDVCWAPCDRLVDGDATYAVMLPSSSGLRTMSGSFELPARDKVTLRVDARSESAYVLGFWSVLMGTVGFVLGGMSLLVGVAEDRGDYELAGAILTPVSLGLVIAGTLLFANNEITVDTDRGEQLARQNAPRSAPRFSLTTSGGAFVF